MDCESFRDDMLDVLYGEGDGVAGRRFASHEAACPSCRQELAELRRLRGDLARWPLPARLRAPLAAPPGARVWLAAAAAAAILALGLAASGSELRYENGHLTARLGRPREDVGALLAAQEQRHRRAIEALRAEMAERPERDDAALLQKMARMIEDSEARQTSVIETSLGGFRREAEVRRRYDLARVSAGMAYLDGKAGLQAARTTELVGQILQASQQR